MNILISGGCGYLGSEISRQLLVLGHSITSFHTSNPHFNSIHHRCILNLDDLVAKRDYSSISFDAVIILHSRTILERNILSNGFTYQDVPDEFLDILGKLNPGKVIFASSGGALYSDSDPMCPRDESANVRPLTVYGIEKLRVEKYLADLKNSKQGIHTLSIRIANLYGLTADNKFGRGLIPTLLEAAVSKREIEIVNSKSIRDYIHVRDVAKLFVKATQEEFTENILNAGTGVGTSNEEIIELVSKKLGVEIAIKRVDSPPHVSKYNVLNSDLARKELEWEPKIDLNQGLDQFLKFDFRSLRSKT